MHYIPVATNIPPPKQFNTDRLNFWRAALRCFMRRICIVHSGSATHIALTINIANKRKEIAVTKLLSCAIFLTEPVTEARADHVKVK